MNVLFIFLNIKRVQSLFGKHLYHLFYGFLWRVLSSGGAKSNRQSSNLPYSLQNTQSLVTAVNRSNDKSWNQSVWLNALLPSFTYDEKWTNYSCQFTSSSAIVGKPLKPFIPKSGCNVWAPGWRCLHEQRWKRVPRPYTPSLCSSDLRSAGQVPHLCAVAGVEFISTARGTQGHWSLSL